MKIERVEFVGSASHVDECPAQPILEIALSGRSNVGKSSLLNSLLGRKGMARVSSTPGKTQLLNYFRINDRFHLVDLPGYGFARAPGNVRRAWRVMMQGYLQRRGQLRAVVQLLDVRHKASPEDHEMIEWLLAEQLSFCLVATKMDKLKQSARKPALVRLLEPLQLPDDLPLVPFSSKKAEGRKDLLGWLETVLVNGTTRSESNSESAEDS